MFAVQSLQRMHACVLEGQPGTLEEVTGRPRNKDLARRGERHHSARLRGRRTPGVGTLHLDLARAQAILDRKARPLCRARHRDATPDGAGGAIEDREETVAGRRDFAPAEPLERLANQRLCRASRSRHRASPSSLARTVESTMSVISSVATIWL